MGVNINLIKLFIYIILHFEHPHSKTKNEYTNVMAQWAIEAIKTNECVQTNECRNENRI